MTAPRAKLDIDVTREKLTALGCGYAAAALEPLLAEAVRSELAAHLFLERLLDAERAGREERRIATMLKSSKIPTGQTLENFDFAFQPAIERSRIETLATGAWIRNAEVLLLQGPPGVGKSQVSRAVPGPMPRGSRRSFRLRTCDRGSGPVSGVSGTGPWCRREPSRSELRRA